MRNKLTETQLIKLKALEKTSKTSQGGFLDGYNKKAFDDALHMASHALIVTSLKWIKAERLLQKWANEGCCISGNKEVSCGIEGDTCAGCEAKAFLEEKDDE